MTLNYISVMAWGGGGLLCILSGLCIVLALAVGVLSFRYKSLRKRYSEMASSLGKEIESLMSKKFVAGPADIKVDSPDDGLMKKALELMESNMDNSEYDVTSFVADMAVSRTVLYQKIRECTGMSIREFMTDIRLQRARQLLGDSSCTIAEISFMTGFANPKYFSVCFKKTFGMSPTEYRSESTYDSAEPVN